MFPSRPGLSPTQQVLLALPLYYLVSAMLAVIFYVLTGEVRLVEAPQTAGVMVILGWVAMLAALDDSSLFGDPAPVQLAMVVALALTPAILVKMGKRRVSGLERTVAEPPWENM